MTSLIGKARSPPTPSPFLLSLLLPPLLIMIIMIIVIVIILLLLLIEPKFRGRFENIYIPQPKCAQRLAEKQKSQCPSVCKVPIDYFSDFPFFLWRVFFPL